LTGGGERAADAGRQRSELEERLGYTFRDATLLVRALTHRSRVQEQGLSAADQNERLEFLGDAVVQLVVSDLLLAQQPDAAEGALSRWRSQVVRQTSLAKVARRLRLGEALHLGVGEERSGGRRKESILCAAYEAVVGAIYQEGGLTVAHPVVERHVAPLLATVPDHDSLWDAKTQLQELGQQRWRQLPRYELVETTGPDHERRYRVAVWLADRPLGEGEGSSKKAAEQAAARAAVKRLTAAAASQVADGESPQGR
jgi:ribonuclease-3